MALGIEVYFISSQFGFCEHVLHPGRYDPQKVPVQSPRELTTMAYGTARFSALIRPCLKVATPKMGGFLPHESPHGNVRKLWNLLSGWALTCFGGSKSRTKGGTVEAHETIRKTWKQVLHPNQPSAIDFASQSFCNARCTLRLKLISIAKIAGFVWFCQENSWGAKQTSEKSGSPEKADGTAAAAGWQGCLAPTNFGPIYAGARHFVVHQTVEQRSEFESR